MRRISLIKAQIKSLHVGKQGFRWLNPAVKWNEYMQVGFHSWITLRVFIQAFWMLPCFHQQLSLFCRCWCFHQQLSLLSFTNSVRLPGAHLATHFDIRHFLPSARQRRAGGDIRYSFIPSGYIKKKSLRCWRRDIFILRREI